MSFVLGLSFGHAPATPAIAARQHAVDPTLLDPTLLALNPADLPAGMQITTSVVATNSTVLNAVVTYVGGSIPLSGLGA